MRKLFRPTLFVFIILALLLCACADGKGETVQYDGYTVRTEKSRTDGDANTENDTEAKAQTRNNMDSARIESYVLNKSSMKFHDPSCSAVAEIQEKNRWDYRGTRESVIDMGYSPCGICDP